MKRELKNAIFSWNFLIAVAVTAFTFYIAIADTSILALYKNVDILYLFNLCMQISPLFLFLPFVATLPYGYKFIDEYNSNFFRFSLSRSSYRKYTLTKTVAVVVSAFLAVFLGLILCVAFFAIIAKPIDTNDILYLQLYDTLRVGRTYGCLLDINVYLYIITYIFFMSLFASLWPVIGMISSTYIKNRYVSLIMPFIVFFLSWQLGGRIIYFIPEISRFFVLANVYYGQYGFFGNPYLSALSTVSFVLLWQFVLFLWFKKRVRSCS